MKQYLMVTRNSLMGSLTYRAHFMFQIFSSIFAIIVMYFLWKAVYAASSSHVIRGMTFDQTFLYVSVAAAVFVLLKTWTDWFMSFQIKSGDIIMYFFKPLDHMKLMFFDSLGNVAGNFITITIPSLLAIFLIFSAPLPSPVSVLLFIPSLAMAYVLNFCFDYFIGVTCFRTQSVWGISITKETLILFLSGALIPLPFFPPDIQQFLSFLPFKYMYHTPLSLLALGGGTPADIAVSLGLQAVWIIIMLTVVRLYYRVTIRALTVNGG